MGNYGNLPQTGIAVLTIGGVGIAQPVLAAGIGLLILGIGVALRLSGRRRRVAE